MKLHLATGVAVGLLLSGAGIGNAAVLAWQESFTPDSSGQTVVNIGFDFPISAPTTEALLTVQGGDLADVGWSSLPDYAIYNWVELPPDSGNWVLWEDIAPAGQGIETIHTTATYSSYRFDANSFDNCYGSGFHQLAVCGAVFQYGFVDLGGALVDGDRPFTLSLYTGVPEPSAWAMMLIALSAFGTVVRTGRGKRIARL